LGCDALPKFQLQLQSEIQREFHVTNAMVMIVDTNMLVAIFDDAHAADEGKALAAFQEQVAQYAVTHYQRSKLRMVAVMVGRATRRHRPDPQLAAIAPFDIFVPGLEPWRVRLAEGLTKQLDSMPPLAAVSQDVVRERWRGQGRPELAALELARGTSAGL